MAKQRGEVARGGNRPEPARGRRRDERGGRAAAAAAGQQGGSRGGSNQTGPARDSSRHSRRAISGTDQLEHESPTPGGTADAIRGPIPEGASREDYLGGERPHKTREKDTKTGTPAAAGGKRNEVI